MNGTSYLRTSAATAAALATAVLVAGCGSEDASGSADDPGRGEGDPTAQLYRVRATVLANGEHGPQLCRTMTDSMPPSCGGPDVVGWNWDDVRAHRERGTTYSDPLVLVGTWDGERFNPAEKPRPDDESTGTDTAADFSTPCAELKDDGPGEGKDAGDAARQRTLDRAAKLPGYAGAWLDGDVVNIRFADTGDKGAGPDAAERELRGLWDGPLCVVGAEHTEDELTRIQRQLDENVEGMLGSAVDPVRNAVTLEVVAATPELRRELDRRYGEDTVRLSGWLQPVA